MQIAPASGLKLCQSTLDHSFDALRYGATDISAKKGTKVSVLQRALGHESLDTTSIYIELAREQMDKELQENAL